MTVLAAVLGVTAIAGVAGYLIDKSVRSEEDRRGNLQRDER